MTPETLAATDHRVGFQSLDEELAVDELAVSGALPEWLAGTLVRVTPAQLDPGGKSVRHWFDGLAMLNVFGIHSGGVSYANRFLNTREQRHVREHGELVGRSFATDPCRSIFKRVSGLFSPGMTDNANVNVARLGERWIAMTETPIAIEFDPQTMATVGPVDWAPRIGHASAHPHYDYERRELVSYVARFAPRSAYQLYAVPKGFSGRRPIASHPVREPAYMHSFGMTDRYAVLFEQPLVVNPLQLAFGDKPFIENYRWKPERGTRFLVFDRDRMRLAASVEAEAFFTFHNVNAFEDDGELVVDLVAYDDPSIIDALYLNKLRAGESPAPSATGRLRRYRLPLEGGSARREDLSDEPLELPRIAYRTRSGRPYRYVYASGVRGEGFLDQLVKIDIEDGSESHWHADGCYAGEPVFVPAPNSDAEDDGVILSVVLDTLAGRSFLLVLDASSFEELARAEAPHTIPFGFHGDFAREES